MYTPKPYAGKDKYIFVSYSHRDTYQVFPIISKLIGNGYRVWFDAGIDPGTEWDENIAQHINECGYFITFMSSNYLASNNCKDELNYARDLEKERLIVYLEDVQLPAGMAMRVNRLQSIFKYTYVNDDEFYAKLFAAKNIDSCCERKVQTPPPAQKVQTPPPAQRVQTPPPVQKVQTPPPTEQKKPQGNGDIPTYTQRVNPQNTNPQGAGPSQTATQQPKQVPPQQQTTTAVKNAAANPANVQKPKMNLFAVLLIIGGFVVMGMSMDYLPDAPASLGALYVSMVLCGVGLFMEKTTLWRVISTVIYWIDVVLLCDIMKDRVWLELEKEYMQYLMPAIFILLYFGIRKASLKKVNKS